VLIWSPNGKLIAQVNNDVRYFLGDVQGSTRLLSDATGAITSSYDYSAFGELTDSPSVETKYLYTGQQYDAATAMYSLRARYYNPAGGRFLSRDVWPVDYGDTWELNRYGYAGGNPVRWTDPTGWLGDNHYLMMSMARLASATSDFIAKPFVSGFIAGVAGYVSGILIYSTWQALISSGDKWETFRGTLSIKWSFSDAIFAGLFGGALSWIQSKIGPFKFSNEPLPGQMPYNATGGAFDLIGQIAYNMTIELMSGRSILLLLAGITYTTVSALVGNLVNTAQTFVSEVYKMLTSGYINNELLWSVVKSAALGIAYGVSIVTLNDENNFRAIVANTSINTIVNLGGLSWN
jgi:RHS repeat-associated protein